MALVFIHGIAQDPDPAHQVTITKDWRDALAPHDQGGRIAAQPVRLAYYADILAARSDRAGVPDILEILFDQSAAAAGFAASVAREVLTTMDLRQNRSMGREASSSDTLQKLGQLYRPLRARLTPVRLAREPSRDSLLENLKRFLMEADTYFTEPAAAAEIDARVRGVLEGALAGGARPIIITHSLGTVIAYKLLSQMSANYALGQVPLLITMGSPLSLKVIRKRLPAPFVRAPIIASWRNHYDQRDFVAAGSPIPVNGDPQIRNHSRGNMQFPYHSADGYLQDPLLAGQVLAQI